MKFSKLLESSENFDKILGKNLEEFPFNVGFTRGVLKNNIRTFCNTDESKRILFQFSKCKDGMEILVFDRKWDSHCYVFVYSDCKIENMYSYDESEVSKIKYYLKFTGISDKQLRQIYKEIVLTCKYFI